VATETWYERAAWIYLALVSAIALPLAALVHIDPTHSIGLWARFGYDLPAAVAGDPASMEYVQFIGHWASTGSIGFNLFGLLIAVTAFRRGQRWAWLAFWYWPVMFATHFATYTSSFRYAQLLWLTFSLAALLATRRRVWAATTALDVACDTGGRAIGSSQVRRAG
jgi:hypothetical protein